MAAFDTRVAELEQRTTAVRDELQRAREARNLAPARDADALAKWIADGERGTRPQPTVPDLDRRTADLERERDALTKATDDVLDEKARYVERHRKRLARDAQAHADKQRERYERLIGELVEARAELADARQATVWAAVFPARSAGSTPPLSIAGGMRRVLERANIAGQVSAEQVRDLLIADASWLSTAVTQEQAEAMGLSRPGEAVWLGTPEGREADRAEKDKALQRHRELFGTEPV